MITAAFFFGLFLGGGRFALDVDAALAFAALAFAAAAALVLLSVLMLL